MVENENLCKIAGYITEILNATEHLGFCAGAKAFSLSDDCIKTFKTIPGLYDSEHGEFKAKVFHRALYDMNRNAMFARYGECADAYEPYDGKMVDVLEATREEWQCRLFMLIRNYIYQCSEGNVPETALFKAMQEIADILAYKIANETAKRDWGCGWGEWKPREKGERTSHMKD